MYAAGSRNSVADTRKILPLGYKCIEGEERRGTETRGQVNTSNGKDMGGDETSLYNL